MFLIAYVVFNFKEHFNVFVTVLYINTPRLVFCFVLELAAKFPAGCIYRPCALNYYSLCKCVLAFLWDRMGYLSICFNQGRVHNLFQTTVLKVNVLTIKDAMLISVGQNCLHITF